MNPTPEILPPHSPENEAGVLGCALHNPLDTLLLLAEQRVSELWFYDLRHQTIFLALQRLHNAKRETPINFISVLTTLKEMGLLEEIGGHTYLNQLQDGVPSAANLAYYLGVVREKWRLRTLLAWAAETTLRVRNFTGDNLDQLVDSIESHFLDTTAPTVARTEKHIKEVIMDSVIPLIERHYNRGKTQLDGLPTGDNWYLDKVLLGLAPNDYVILAGRPGEGKTSLALNIVNHLATDYVWFREVPEAEAKQLELDGHNISLDEPNKKFFQRMRGIPVGVFTLEMTEESLGFRLVFGRAEVSSGSFRQGFAEKDMWNRVNKSVAELCKTNIYLDGEADQTIDMIAAKARRWARQYGIKLFVLDYLQLLDGDDGRDNDRVRALRKISKRIVSLKKKLGIPWLVLAQMNRNIETSERARRPVMSDLKESGSLEQDADKIVILYHPLKTEGIEEDEEQIESVMAAEKVAMQDWPRRINALVVKNRNGPTGVAAMVFQNNQCRFQDWRRWCVDRGVVARAAGEAKGQADLIDPEDVP